VNSERPESGTRRALLGVAAVIGVSLVFGLGVLPRLGKSRSVEGLVAPDFELAVLVGGSPGNRLRLSHLAGKAVVLDFWASWCGPCRAQAPIVEELSRERAGGDVVVLGVNTSDDRADALAFARSASLSYTTVLDEGTRVAAAYGVSHLPTMVIVGRSGRIVAVRKRLVRRDELERLVAQALEN
jgi:thiol-disulfide isomerase/thioredoxin